VKENIISFDKIKKILPHRYPFLLIDRVLSITKESIMALKNVTANEPFFSGHFPNLAVMPGVLQLEAMAQAAGLILASDENFMVDKEIVFLAGIDKAKFKKVVTPGDQLVLEAEVIKKKQNLLKVSATASVEKEIASSATIILVIRSL
jgi:3-hydroxyacyl-[acyl-carrier-protein] dehydratase